MSHQTPLSAEQTFALLQQQQALQTDFARLKPHPLCQLYRLTGCALIEVMLMAQQRHQLRSRLATGVSRSGARHLPPTGWVV